MHLKTEKTLKKRKSVYKMKNHISSGKNYKSQLKFLFIFISTSGHLIKKTTNYSKNLFPFFIGRVFIFKKTTNYHLLSGHNFLKIRIFWPDIEW